MSSGKSAEKTRLGIRVGVASNNKDKRSQEQDSMDGYTHDEQRDERAEAYDVEAKGNASEHRADDFVEAAARPSDFRNEWDAEDDELMTIVDPMIDKASRESNHLDDDSSISESSAFFDDDVELDDHFDDVATEDVATEDLATEDRATEEVDDEVDEFADAEIEDENFDDSMQFDQLDEFLSDDAEAADDTLENELKEPLTASQQALEARRAIEERAEARRMERDLNYLDFELDD